MTPAPYISCDDTLDRIVRVLDSEPSVAAAYIFGSFGTARFNCESDIDVGVLFGREMAGDRSDLRMALNFKLEEAAGREVNLVCLDSVSPVLGMQVIRHGKKIFEKDRRAAEEFFVRTVESYADLKMVRREIEARVLEGGIYG